MTQEQFFFINPFHIDIDPMERLLLVNMEKDPDTTYVGFEPQVFDDKSKGKGHLIIGWRVDGKVDVYHQPILKPDPEKYTIAGKGLANMVEREMTTATFEVNEYGVQACYEFKDIQNRSIKIKIKEKNPKTRRPFGLLAPMGSAAETPTAMPMVFLHDFYFVRKKHTEIEVSIDTKPHQLDKLPLPMDWSKMYFTRYSPEPLIATFNPAFEGELPMVEVEIGTNSVTWGNYEMELAWENEMLFIRRITRMNEVYPVELRFKGGFPDMMRINNNTLLKGEFEIEAHPSTGRIKGHYTLEKKDHQIKISMIPSGGWKPRPTKFSLYFLYIVAKIFRNWPKTYQWTAQIRKESSGNYFMQSNWKRIK